MRSLKLLGLGALVVFLALTSLSAVSMGLRQQDCFITHQGEWTLYDIGDQTFLWRSQDKVAVATITNPSFLPVTIVTDDLEFILRPSNSTTIHSKIIGIKLHTREIVGAFSQTVSPFFLAPQPVKIELFLSQTEGITHVWVFKESEKVADIRCGPYGVQDGVPDCEGLTRHPMYSGEASKLVLAPDSDTSGQFRIVVYNFVRGTYLLRIQFP